MNSPEPKLDARPARALTDREIVKIFCGMIGGLLEFCEYETVRRAVHWLDSKDEVWGVIRAASAKGKSS